MKKILTAFLAVCIFAATQVGAIYYPEWEDMQITANYDSSNQKLIVSADVRGESAVENHAYLDIMIDGEKYSKSFKYNRSTGMLEVSFIIPESSLQADYPYTFTVKNTQFYELYRGNGNFHFSDGVNNGNSSLGNNAGYTNMGNITISYPTGVSHPGNANQNNDGFFSNNYINTNNNNNYAVYNPDPGYNYRPGTNHNNNNYYNNNGYMIPDNSRPIINRPTYHNRYDEPSKINGIGNKVNYRSWRAVK